MIIWINGAFGSGKTQTAFELHRRIPNSYVYDPENIGFFIRKNVPKEIHKGNFQNYLMWREFNYSMLKYIDSEYKGILIVPMTIVNPQFFNEIVGKLRDDGILLNHFTLCASKQILIKRLKSRGEGENSWAAKQIDQCINALAEGIFQHHLDTDNISIEDIVEQIASMSSVTLLPNNHCKLYKKLTRATTQLKHIRLFSWRI